MKKYIIIIITIIILFLIIYGVGTLNIAFIKPTVFFNTAFEEKNSTWYCSDFNVKAVVPDIENAIYMNLTDLNTGEEYILLALDNSTAELYHGNDDTLSYEDWIGKPDLWFGEPLYVKSIVFKKKWGKVYKFVIKGVNEDCWYNEGSVDLVFKLRDAG